MKVVILAGGIGSRLWPISRKHNPKQLQGIVGTTTLLKATYKRLRLGFKPKDILVATGVQYASEVRKQLPTLPKNNILCEPIARDSAGAIGLALARVYAENPTETLISVPGDSHIIEDKKFVKKLIHAEAVLEKYPKQVLMYGIKPRYPETGYGYIQVIKKSVHSFSGLYRVKKFIEKPSLNRARRYTQRNDYYWNPSHFAWRADHLLDLYKKFLPRNYSRILRIAQAPQAAFQQVVNREFPKFTSTSIDYGIHEKTKQILMFPLEVTWADVGHWRSVAEMSKKDLDGNVAHGTSMLLDSRNNFLMSNSKKLITAIGVQNLVMIETEDVILLVDKSRAQEVKSIVERLKKSALKKYT